MKKCPFCGEAGKMGQAAGVWWAECGGCMAATRGERTEAAALGWWERRCGDAANRGADSLRSPTPGGDREAVERARRLYPLGMPAQAAMRYLGVSRNTFFRRARAGEFAVLQGESGHRRYETAGILAAMQRK